jgi:hypothetical protein
MAVYRIYFVDEDGKLQPDESFYCRTDQEAIGRLKLPEPKGMRAELWQGGRFIALAMRGRPRLGIQPQAWG